MIKGQVLTDLKDVAGARAAYNNGVKVCPRVPSLWILTSRLEEADGRAIKSRALLEKARLLNPKDETLWSEAVSLEERTSGVQQAKTLLARGESDRSSRKAPLKQLSFRFAGMSLFRSAVVSVYLAGAPTSPKESFS